MDLLSWKNDDPKYQSNGLLWPDNDDKIYDLVLKIVEKALSTETFDEKKLQREYKEWFYVYKRFRGARNFIYKLYQPYLSNEEIHAHCKRNTVDIHDAM